MLELMSLFVFAVLCSSTQGIDRLFETKNKVYTILNLLVLVTAECFNDVAVFWCTGEMGFLIWDARTRTGSSTQITFHSGQLVGTTVTRTLNTSSAFLVHVILDRRR